ASLPTSPSAVTLWIAMNSCPDWNLRVFPGSHRRGLLWHAWVALDDPRLAAVGPPGGLPPRGRAAGPVNCHPLPRPRPPRPRRRGGCDIRFFPLCGFLPSRVHGIGPIAVIDEGLARRPGPVLRAPLRESQVFLGLVREREHAEPHSVLNWVNYIGEVVAG